MKVATVDEMRAMDRRAIEEFAIPEEILMENAGQAVFSWILGEIGVREKRFAVLCALGNNGGDGMVVARKLHSVSARVKTLILGDPSRYRGCARLNYEMLRASGAEIVVEPPMEAVREAIGVSDVVVDALFGTGITREVGGRFREVIEELNRSGETVVAVDIPSGVDGDTGRIRGVAVRADATVTFGLPKRGNVLYPGAELGGRLFVTHISFPPAITRDETVRVALSRPPRLPARRVDGHKGTFGDVLFIAGAASYFGAPSLAALSMLKAGGGYSRLAAPRSIVPTLAGLGSEIVFAPQEETAAGSLALGNADRLLDLGGRVDFVVLGPGVSLAGETRELVRRLAAGIGKPLLIDGDGLTAIAEGVDAVRRRSQPTVLTPHAGEMARLTGQTIAEVQADPIGVVQRLAEDLGATVVLKGARSLVALADGRVWINPTGNSGLASAGSGDVLTGTIAAMVGLGLGIGEAVRTGVFLHGFAGDLAAGERGEDGITARDVLEHLPAATRAYRESWEQVTADFYGSVEML